MLFLCMSATANKNSCQAVQRIAGVNAHLPLLKLNFNGMSSSKIDAAADALILKVVSSGQGKFQGVVASTTSLNESSANPDVVA